MQRFTTEHQERLHRSFTAALDLLDRQNREPDRWEEECLSYALGAMACGLYSAAEVELAAFSRPVTERPPEEVALLDTKPSRFTREMLRRGLDYVRHRNRESQNAMDDVSLPAAGHLAVRSFLGASL
ncbi:hypothetical protein [Reyranella sp.]|jgi:hypothetical protein|uniref:hypothetical protein n=1 Tax=Reyranella sp. TaxID=1929291 RepID=UPI002F937412